MKQGDGQYSIYLANRAALIDYAAPILGSRETAEDIVQEAFLKLASARGWSDGPTQPGAYLYRIVRNLSLDFLRRKKLENRELTEQVPYWTIPRAEATPEQRALFSDDIRRVSAMLAEMPVETRIAVEMHRFGGCKLEEVAAHLGISVATAHRMIHTALVEIARRIGRE